MTDNYPLAYRYNMAYKFHRPTVIRLYWNGVTPMWATLGPGHLHLGCQHSTFEEAIKEAIDGHTE